MAITSSGEIKLSDLFKEQNETTDEPGTNDNLTLDTFSDNYGANASTVGVSRATLTGDEDKISHFYSATFPGNFSFDSINIGSLGNPIGSNDDTLVGTETLVVEFQKSNNVESGDTANLSIVQSNGGDLTGTNSNESSLNIADYPDSYYEVSLSSVNLDNTFDGSTVKLKVIDSNNSFDSNFSSTFTYRDKLSGGGLTLTATPTSVNDSGDSVSVGFSGTATEGTVNSVTITDMDSTDGAGTTDGGIIDGTYNSLTEAINVSNAPGILRVTATLQGLPNNSRNRLTSVQETIAIPYTRQIDNLQGNTTNLLTGNNITISADSKGAASTTMRLGYDNLNTGTSYDASSDKSVDSTYKAESESQAFTLNHSSPNSSTSREGPFYPKAHYLSGDTNLTIGTAFHVYPNLVISTSGTAGSVDVVSGAQNYSATLTSGYNAGITIATDFPGVSDVTSFGSNLTITPNNENGSFDIDFTGTATANSNFTETKTLVIRPKVLSLTEASSITAVDTLGSYSTGLTPTGHTTNTAFSFSTTRQGDNIVESETNWTIPSGFSTTSGGDGNFTLAGNFGSGVSNGTNTFRVTVAGGGATSTEETYNVTANNLTQQAMSSITTDNQTVRRGESNGVVANFNSTNVDKVDVYLVRQTTLEGGEVDGGNPQLLSGASGDSLTNTKNTSTAQTLTYNVPELSRSTIGLYDVFVQDEDTTGGSLPTLRTDATYDIQVKDKAPTTPGSFTTAGGGTGASQGYSGDQVISWGASTYGVRYKVHQSAGASDSGYSLFATTATADNPTESTTITAHATNTINRFYKVLAENDNSSATNYGGASISDEASSFNSPVQYIVFPVADNTKNVINNNGGIIRSTLNNSTTTTLTFNPSTQTDSESFVNRTYSLTSNPSSATLSNATTSTYGTHATLNANTNTGTHAVQLVTNVEGGRDTDTTSTSSSTIYIYHYPKLTDINMDGGDASDTDTISVKVGSDAFEDQIIINGIGHQGLRTTDTGQFFKFKIVESGDSSNLTDTGTLNFVDSGAGELVDSHLVAQSAATDLAVNMGRIPSSVSNSITSATVLVQFSNNVTGDTVGIGDGFEIGTIAINHPTIFRIYQTTGTTLPEDAYLDNSGESTSNINTHGAFLLYGSLMTEGSPSQTLYTNNSGTFEVVIGGSKFFSIHSFDGSTSGIQRDVFRVGGGGAIDLYYNSENVPPKAPTNPSTSTYSRVASITSIDTPSNYTWGYSTGQTINLNGQTTTYDVTYNWNDNSSIEDGYRVSLNGGGFSNKSANTTSHTETGLSATTHTLTIKAYRGTNESSTIDIGVTPSGTSAVFVQAVLYVSVSSGGGYAWSELNRTNIDSSSGGSISLGGTDTPPPPLSSAYESGATPTGLNKYQFKLIAQSTGYGGTTIATSNAFNVSENTNLKITDSGGDAGATLTDIDNFTYGDFYWYGLESSGLSTSTTGTSRIYAYINDATNYLSKAVSGSMIKTEGLADAGDRLGYLQTQTTSTTVSYPGSSPFNFQHMNLNTETLMSGAGFDNVNDKIFFVIDGTLTISPGAGDDVLDEYEFEVTSDGYTTRTYTLRLESADEGGAGTCFIVGTQVMLSNGTWKNIEDITFEDSIKSISLPNAIESHDFNVYGKWEESSIDGMTEEDSEPVFISRDTFYDYYKLTLEDDSEIKVTWEHPFVIYRDNVYKWSKAEDLEVGDVLVTKDDTKVSIDLIEEISQDDEFVTLDVEEVDTYLVKAGNNAFIVHNSDKGGGY